MRYATHTQQMSGLFDAIGDVVSQTIDVIAGGPQKRERAAQRQAQADIAAAEAAEEAARYGYLGEVVRARAEEQQAVETRKAIMISAGALVVAVLIFAWAKR